MGFASRQISIAFLFAVMIGILAISVANGSETGSSRQRPRDPVTMKKGDGIVTQAYS